MNKDFEKLPEIAELLKIGDIFFNDVYEAYGSKSNNDLAAGFVNGALYAYQEQQKKIDVALLRLNKALDGAVIGERYAQSMGHVASKQAYQETIYELNAIKELLK